MIWKWVREQLEKYSFVTKVELKKSYVYIYYELGETKDWKRISVRATSDKLIHLIENIKEEIGYYEDLENRKKEGQYEVGEKPPLMFVNG